jgi:hypothetical protein
MGTPWSSSRRIIQLNMRLTPEDRIRIALLGEHYNLNHTDVIRLLLKERSDQLAIVIPPMSRSAVDAVLAESARVAPSMSAALARVVSATLPEPSVEIVPDPPVSAALAPPFVPESKRKTG